MTEIIKGGKDYVGYEYKTLSTNEETISMMLDCYESFGFKIDERATRKTASGNLTVTLKRNRNLINKAEITRLQRNFESYMHELEQLKKSKTSKACMSAIITGVVGTAFMALSVFAITATTPNIPLCVLFAVPGFVGWIVPYFLYKKMVAKKESILVPLIDE